MFSASVLLPTPPLAGPDGDHVLDLRQGRRPRLRRRRRPGPLDLGRLRAGSPQRRRRLAADRLAGHGRRRRTGVDADADGVAVQLDALDHVQQDDVLEQLRVLDGPQGRQHLFLAQCHESPECVSIAAK